MSDHHVNDPFATPGPGAPQWQGTPVPASPTVVPPPPAGYMYAPTYAPTNTANNWMGVTSLILSLSSFIFGITCIPGVIIGHLGLSAAKKGTANNRGLALAGVIIGWVFLGFGLLGIALFVVIMSVDVSGF